jgi:uncharacterized protein YegJ (DUF2314 family)
VEAGYAALDEGEKGVVLEHCDTPAQGVMKFLFTILLLMTSFASNAQNEGKLILVNNDDQAMADAFAKAKETLDQFIFRATEQRKEYELYGAYVKVEEDDVVEYLWVGDFKRYNEEYFMGVLITKPELTKQFSEGATIGFRKEDIYDWQIYNQNTDVMEGAFTFEVLQGKK